MNTKDTSGHEKRMGPDMTSSLSQGNDTAANPAHGTGTDNVHHSLKHGEGKYMPNTHDMDSRDDHSAHDEDDTFC